MNSKGIRIEEAAKNIYIEKKELLPFFITVFMYI